MLLFERDCSILHVLLNARRSCHIGILQQMWRYLEPLFIHSDEVKKELPLDTKRFEKIDGQVKATLVELWNVKKVCYHRLHSVL